MPRILVTPLSGLADALSAQAPSHLISLLSPEHMIATPAGFPEDRHLKLGINDIVDPDQGTAPPARIHVEQLLAFSRDWDTRQPMVIHCWAGISRSMASAYTILCDRLGPGSEVDVARAIRERAPHAQPNRLLVYHADSVLARGGRMLAAMDALGPAKFATEGVPTVFPLVGLSE